MSAADKLREARKLIKRGWCQNHYAKNGKCCIRGALDVVGGGGNGTTLAKLMGEAIGDHQLCMWNDAAGRTKAEVLAAFDRAIALAEQQP